MSLIDMWSFGTDACWFIQSNGNKTSKTLADKLIEWSKIENDYAKKLASFKKSITEDKVFSEVKGATLGDGLVQLFSSLAIEVERHSAYSKKLETTSTDLTKWRKVENTKAKEQLGKADKIMKEFQNLKTKFLKTQQLLDKSARTLEHYIDRRDGADGEVVVAKLEEAKAKFLRTEQTYYDDYDTAQKQLLDNKQTLEDIMKYMQTYEQDRITHLKEILDNLMDERINNENNISKALAGVKKLINCINVQMDINNMIAQVKIPEPFTLINTRSRIIQSEIHTENHAPLAMIMAISSLQNMGNRNNNNNNNNNSGSNTSNNSDRSGAASIRIDPHLLCLLSTNNTENPQQVIQNAFHHNDSDTISCSNSNNNNNNNNSESICSGNSESDMEVIYNYKSTQNGVLSVKTGDIIKNVNVINNEWISGEVNGNRGMIPKTFVKPIQITTNQIVSDYQLSCIAIYDCQSDDSKILNFSKGEKLYYKNSTTQNGWLEGKNDKGQCGLIPESYVNKI